MEYPPKKGITNAGVMGTRPPVPEVLNKYVEVRRNWIGIIGKVLGELPMGEVRGLAVKSIYEGIGDGVGLGEGDEERDERWVEDGLDVEGVVGEERMEGVTSAGVA